MIIKRNYTLDLFRLLASFAIVCIHSSKIGASFEVKNAMLLSSRWAVPFFFLLSGYFLADKLKDKIFFPKKSLVKLISIHIVSSLIFLVVKILSNQPISLGLVNLLVGTDIHLWFIGSLIFGILVVWYFYQINLNKYLTIISAIILLYTTFTDGYDFLLEKKLSYMPFLTSISFIHLGMLIKNKTLIFNRKLLLLIVIVLFLLQFLENHLLNEISKQTIYQTLSISTILFSFFLFYLIVSLKIIPTNIISQMGSKYSLFIYLYHPIFILIFSFYNINNVINPMAELFIIFIITLSCAMLINKLTPILFNLVNGDLIQLNKN